MKTRTIISTCMLSLLIWLFSLSQASAVSIVTYDNNFNSLTNEWTYAMTVENQDADPLYDLTVDTGGVVLPDLAVYYPAGWSNVDIGTDFIHWMADLGSEIVLGDSLPGFYFTYTGTATDDIGSIPYHTITWNNVTGANPTCNGMTGSSSVCPSSTPVPEPGTLLLFFSGMMTVIFIRHKREKYI